MLSKVINNHERRFSEKGSKLVGNSVVSEKVRRNEREREIGRKKEGREEKWKEGRKNEMKGGKKKERKEKKKEGKKQTKKKEKITK